MAFSDDVRKTVEDVIQKGAGLAQMGVNMAAQMGNIAKLKAANQTEENAIRKAYTELGKRYYVAHAADENAEFSDVLQEIETATSAGPSVSSWITPPARTSCLRWTRTTCPPSPLPRSR